MTFESCMKTMLCQSVSSFLNGEWLTWLNRGSLKLCVVNTWADRRSNLIRIIYTITPSRHIGTPPEIFTVLAAIICTVFFIESVWTSWKKKNYWYHNGFYLLVPLLFHFVRCCKKNSSIKMLLISPAYLSISITVTIF